MIRRFVFGPHQPPPLEGDRHGIFLEFSIDQGGRPQVIATGTAIRNSGCLHLWLEDRPDYPIPQSLSQSLWEMVLASPDWQEQTEF